ncbi:glycine zipper 2TM domain-containing protein [Sandaracinobacteroides hominis]|uniref:glycine zipper 2TM domain-containing protein n=1 Tax=Sandaracinobacteroides hominis TaxID=2780086 RepID=UPI0018F467D6|nr:glycine zipper 2TM domain-containing protein [Sandaracinobacteroides hominis]
MRTAYAALTAGLATLSLAGPAFADDDRRWHGDRDYRHNGRHYDKYDRRDDRRDNAQSYRQGYRDGVRADNRRDAYYAQRRGPVYSYNAPDYRYGNNYPVYRGASYNSSAPYWWGSNGQVQCRRQDGTTGLIVGALAGGTLGNVLAREGDKRLGSVIGGTLGAVLGNELNKGNVRCR